MSNKATSKNKSKSSSTKSTKNQRNKPGRGNAARPPRSGNKLNEVGKAKPKPQHYGNNPFLNFGPVMNEFVSSKAVKDQEIIAKYDVNSPVWEISLRFSPMAESGVSFRKQIEMDLDSYMAQKDVILRKNVPGASWTRYVMLLHDRLGLDLHAATPQVEFKFVKKFVEENLSPIEQTVLQLRQDEWDLVDATRLEKILEPTNGEIKNHYGGPEGRVNYLVGMINDRSSSVALKPQCGWQAVAPTTRKLLLQAIKYEKEPEKVNLYGDVIQNIKNNENSL